jgi:hypothetical protein
VTTDDALLIIAVGACVVAVAACVLAHYLATQAGAWKAPYWRSQPRRATQRSQVCMVTEAGATSENAYLLGR